MANTDDAKKNDATKNDAKEPKPKEATPDEQILDTVLESTGRQAIQSMDQSYVKLWKASVMGRDEFRRSIRAELPKIIRAEKNMEDVLKEHAIVCKINGDEKNMSDTIRKKWVAYENASKDVLHMMRQLGDALDYPILQTKALNSKNRSASFTLNVYEQSPNLRKKLLQHHLQRK